MIVSQNVKSKTFQRNFLDLQTYGNHDEDRAHFGTHSCGRHRFHGVFVSQISHFSFCHCDAHNIFLKNLVSQAIAVCRETIPYILREHWDLEASSCRTHHSEANKKMKQVTWSAALNKKLQPLKTAAQSCIEYTFCDPQWWTFGQWSTKNVLLLAIEMYRIRHL